MGPTRCDHSGLCLPSFNRFRLAVCLSLCLAITLANLMYSKRIYIPNILMVKSRSRIFANEPLDNRSANSQEGTAERLANDVRVLCWVMTSPKNLNRKAVHVKNTWGKRCNKLLFMSSETNATFPTVGLNVSEGRQHLTAKTMQAFKYCHDFHKEDADWFLKSDDDTYVILENLRHFLKDKDPESPIVYGQHFRVNDPLLKKGYPSGGAGYVLSKQSLKLLAKLGQNSSLCRQDGGYEDLEMGLCMQNLNISLGDTTDKKNRRTFHSFQPKNYIHGPLGGGYKFYDVKSKNAKGIGSFNDYAISFHYINPAQMYDLEYYVYHLKPFGVVREEPDISVPI